MRELLRILVKVTCATIFRLSSIVILRDIQYQFDIQYGRFLTLFRFQKQ